MDCGSRWKHFTTGRGRGLCVWARGREELPWLHPPDPCRCRCPCEARLEDEKLRYCRWLIPSNKSALSVACTMGRRGLSSGKSERGALVVEESRRPTLEVLQDRGFDARRHTCTKSRRRRPDALCRSSRLRRAWTLQTRRGDIAHAPY